MTDFRSRSSCRLGTPVLFLALLTSLTACAEGEGPSLTDRTAGEAGTSAVRSGNSGSCTLSVQFDGRNYAERTPSGGATTSAPQAGQLLGTATSNLCGSETPSSDGLDVFEIVSVDPADAILVGPARAYMVATEYP